MKRKIISTVIAVAMTSGMLAVTAMAEEAISIGDYIQMGTYYDEPIMWRCVDVDENGPLMLSDKIICLKPFDAMTSANSTTGSHSRDTERAVYGSNYWADSNMRSWLNSNESAGNVTWLCGNPPSESYVWNGYNDYADEAGFLTNFTEEERSLMKSVSQKSLVAYPEYNNGIYTTGTAGYTWKYKMNELLQDYNTAYAEYVTDTVFLLDVEQLYRVYKKSSVLGKGYYIGEPTAKCVANSEYADSSLASGKNWEAWLRSPSSGTDIGFCTHITTSSVGYIGTSRGGTIYSIAGVRPAFYLNLTSYAAKSGEGTTDSPYVPGKASDIAAEISTAFAQYISDDNKATGFTATIKNDKYITEAIASVVWTITPVDGTSVEIPVDLPTTITLDYNAGAVIGVILDGLYDENAVADLRI